MRCRDFVAGLLLAGAGRRRATRRGEQQQRSGAPTRRGLFRPTNVPLWHEPDQPERSDDVR